MANVSKVIGLSKLDRQLRDRAAKVSKQERTSVLVGYTQSYALFVHENVEMKWRGLPRRKPAKGVYWGPRGQAKFLEGPARQLRPELARIVTEALVKKKTLAQALILAGLRLQRESQKLVPVDTGALKNSAFTRLEHGEQG